MSLLLKLLSVALFIGTGKYLVAAHKTAFTSGREKCSTECTQGSSGYYYCYVDNGSWDYCGPYISDNKPLIQTVFTLKNEPCKTPCTFNTNYNANTCDNYWGSKDDYCNTTKIVYFQSYTYNGKKCIGKCDKHEGRTYNWCYDENKAEEYCSPYQIEDYISDMMKKIRQDEDNHGTSRNYGGSRQRRQIKNYPHIVFNGGYRV